jgi:quinoprotein glucose dehydrogenase
MNANELGDAVKIALADAEAEVRASALPYLGRLQGDDAARILGDMVVAGMAKENDSSSSHTRLAQAAFKALGDLEATSADFILRMALTNWLAGTVPPALELDLLDAAGHRSDREIKSLLAERQRKYPKDDHLAVWRPVLQGGDADRGRTIFFEKVEVQCSRCHIVKGQGGTVGPVLDGIGKRQTREYLLESMLFPSRAIAAGFESVTVTLKSGAMQAGLVKGEDEKELRLESPEDGPLRLAKSEIVSRQRGLSAMPEGMIEFLSKRELRDLVEFLVQLK